MFIQKLLYWCSLYPIAFIGFFAHMVIQCLMFLFHSPVDIWYMIGEEVDKQQAEEK